MDCNDYNLKQPEGQAIVPFPSSIRDVASQISLHDFPASQFRKYSLNCSLACSSLFSLLTGIFSSALMCIHGRALWHR